MAGQATNSQVVIVKNVQQSSYNTTTTGGGFTSQAQVNDSMVFQGVQQNGHTEETGDSSLNHQLQTNTQNSQNPNNTSSSIFMKYVKQKVNKKINGDRLNEHVADRYIEIYKEALQQQTLQNPNEQQIQHQQPLHMHQHNTNINLDYLLLDHQQQQSSQNVVQSSGGSANPDHLQTLNACNKQDQMTKSNHFLVGASHSGPQPIVHTNQSLNTSQGANLNDTSFKSYHQHQQMSQQKKQFIQSNNFVQDLGGMSSKGPQANNYLVAQQPVQNTVQKKGSSQQQSFIILNNGVKHQPNSASLQHQTGSAGHKDYSQGSSHLTQKTEVKYSNLSQQQQIKDMNKQVTSSFNAYMHLMTPQKTSQNAQPLTDNTKLPPVVSLSNVGLQNHHQKALVGPKHSIGSMQNTSQKASQQIQFYTTAHAHNSQASANIFKQGVSEMSNSGKKQQVNVEYINYNTLSQHQQQQLLQQIQQQQHKQIQNIIIPANAQIVQQQQQKHSTHNSSNAYQLPLAQQQLGGQNPSHSSIDKDMIENIKHIYKDMKKSKVHNYQQMPASNSASSGTQPNALQSSGQGPVGSQQTSGKPSGAQSHQVPSQMHQYPKKY